MPEGSRTIPRSRPPKRTKADAGQTPEIAPTIGKAAGELIAVSNRIRGCDACDRAQPQRAYGTGFPRARVLVVSEQPSVADLNTEGALTDEADALDKAFSALGVELTALYGTTAVRCGSAPASAPQVEACAIHLLLEIEAIEPTVIVACGPRAVDAIRALDGKCGIVVPEDTPQGTAVRLRPGLSMVPTEPMPQAVTKTDSKRRFWKDLQQIPTLLAGDA